MVKDKKSGKSIQCGGSCSHCAGHCSAPCDTPSNRD